LQFIFELIEIMESSSSCNNNTLEKGRCASSKEDVRSMSSKAQAAAAAAEDGDDGDQQATASPAPPAPDTTTTDITNTTTTTETTKPVSKNQMKKRRRQELIWAKKQESKEKKKQARREKALTEGRDLEEERRIQEERTKLGEGWKRRQEQWLVKQKTADASFRVCIDCAFEDQMRAKEINSLAEQIRYCYAMNRRSKNPVYLSVSSLTENGETRGHLNKTTGFPDQWYARAFQCSDKPLTEVHTQGEKLVYLTSDSEHTLEHLEDDKIYIIGGIVDRNRLSRAAITRAEEFGIATAKLPITQYLRLVSTKVLTCNHVFEILLKYREHGNDWKKAMLDVLPARKDVKALDAEEKVDVAS
jgi:tRNA (guanine9-N1)-methyltransferase